MRKKNQRAVWGMALVLFLALAAAACAPAALPTPTPTAAPKPPPAAAAPSPTPPKPTPLPATPTPKPVSLKFGSTGGASYAGAYIAAEKGFFKEQGIDLEVVNFRSIAEMVAPLGTGQVDSVGMPLSSSLLAAADRGIELKLVADSGQHLPNWTVSWIVLRKDLADSGRVKTPADLKGLKIAIPSPGGPGQMTVEMALAEGGLKLSDVELVTLPHAEQVAALGNKAIDAGYTTEPYIVRGVQQGLSVKWIPQQKYFNGRSQSAFMVFGPQLAKDKDLGQRWMIAYLKGVRAYMDAFGEKKVGRDEIVTILTKYTGEKDANLYNVMEMPYFDLNGIPDRKSSDAVYKYFIDSGEYKGKTTLDNLFDLSLVENAVQKLGKR